MTGSGVARQIRLKPRHLKDLTVPNPFSRASGRNVVRALVREPCAQPRPRGPASPCRRAGTQGPCWTGPEWVPVREAPPVFARPGPRSRGPGPASRLGRCRDLYVLSRSHAHFGLVIVRVGLRRAKNPKGEKDTPSLPFSGAQHARGPRPETHSGLGTRVGRWE